jgi:transposase
LKEKQEQLLKAEKEKEHLLRLKMVRKMLDKGNSVETIADLLEVSVLQIQEWVKLFKN